MATGLASGLQGARHITALVDTAEIAFNAIPVENLLMYVVDFAPESALIFLAEQFNVLGWKGWRLATTEAQKRNLIKQAVILQQKKGTAWAIKNALKTAGFVDATIIKGAERVYDGSFQYDGSEDYGGGFWATFAVRIDIPLGYVPTPEDQNAAEKLINEYKNERSALIGVTWRTVTTA